MRLVVRVVEHLVPLLLCGVEHLFRLVSQVRRVAVGVSAEPAVGDLRVLEPIGDALHVVADHRSQFTSGWHILLLL